MPLSRRAACLWLAAALIVAPHRAWGGPINTNTALTPRKGGTILRLQYRYSEADSHGPVVHASTSTAIATLVHGVTPNLALFLTVPYVHQQVDRFAPRLGRFERTRDGIADGTVMAKYRFWQDDRRPGETTRWAALLGMNIRSGDSDFSSESYDPIAGTVFSWRRDRDRFDADLVYQFNTGRAGHRHDTLRYDLAYSYRLFPEALGASPYEVDVVAELNGRYGVDGSHEVFLSPGLQLLSMRWAVEASIQLPAIQNLAGDGPETDYRLVVSVRYQW